MTLRWGRVVSGAEPGATLDRQFKGLNDFSDLVLRLELSPPKPDPKVRFGTTFGLVRCAGDDVFVEHGSDYDALDEGGQKS